MSTYNWSVLETLGSRLIVSKKFPEHNPLQTHPQHINLHWPSQNGFFNPQLPMLNFPQICLENVTPISATVARDLKFFGQIQS